jgi:hypothetical protein
MGKVQSALTAGTRPGFFSVSLTAALFYNAYEWTEFGKKLDTGAGWRSALIIGGISGLLNERVIAALQDLFG